MKDRIEKQFRQTTAALMAIAVVLSVFGSIGTVAAAPGVSVTQTADSTTVTPGGMVTFTATISATDVNGPTLDAQLPDGWTITEQSSDGGQYSPEKTDWVWLSPGEHTVTYTVQVPEDATEATVSVTGGGTNPTTGNYATYETAQTTITVQEAPANTAPTADAGSDQTVDEEADVTLDASDTSDLDGDSLSYSWTQTAGPSVILSDADTATPTFTAPDVDSATTLTFEVSVSDGNGGTNTDTVSVTVQPVNEQPTASISGPTNAQVGEEVTFTASASDNGSIESYEWDFDGDGTATGESVSHAFSAAGDYTVELTVTDDEGATATATQTVSVSEAAAPANFQVSGMNAPSSATQGDSVTVSATVENAGDEEATQTVSLSVDGTEFDSEDVTLVGGASQSVEFTLDTSSLATGQHDVSIATANDTAIGSLTVDAATEPPADAMETTVSLSPSDELAGVDQSETLDVVVDPADGGVGAVNLTVSLENTSVATITSANFQNTSSMQLEDVQVTEDGSSATMQVILMDTADTGAVTVGSVTVQADAVGTTAIDVSVTELGNENGTGYTVTEQGATLEVSNLVVGDSEAPAQDLDGDGDHEDVNGDGTVDVLDIQTLWSERTTDVVTQNEGAFDFNGDGQFNLLDLQTLYAQELA